MPRVRILSPRPKNKLTLDTIGRNADGIGLFKEFFPSKFKGKTKDLNRSFIQAEGIKTPKTPQNLYPPF